MSGGGGGGNTTTVQKSDPPAYLQPYLLQTAVGAGEAYKNPLQFYPGATYAGPSNATQYALTAQEQRAAAGSPLTRAGQNELTKTLSGDYLNAGNPYFSQMMNNVAADIAPRINAQFSAAGRYGSGAHEHAVASALANTAGQLAFQNYGQERENQMRGMLFAPQMAQQDYFDIAKMAEAGAAREDADQAAINDAVNRFNFQQMEPWQRLQLYSGILNGINTGGITTATQQLPRRSLGERMLGGAASGAGIGLMFGNPILGAGIGGLLGMF